MSARVYHVAFDSDAHLARVYHVAFDPATVPAVVTAVPATDGGQVLPRRIVARRLRGRAIGEAIVLGKARVVVTSAGATAGQSVTRGRARVVVAGGGRATGVATARATARTTRDLSALVAAEDLALMLGI